MNTEKPLYTTTCWFSNMLPIGSSIVPVWYTIKVEVALYQKHIVVKEVGSDRLVTVKISKKSTLSNTLGIVHLSHVEKTFNFERSVLDIGGDANFYFYNRIMAFIFPMQILIIFWPRRRANKFAKVLSKTINNLGGQTTSIRKFWSV